MEVFREGKGIFVRWVGTCFPTDAIRIHTVLSGKIRIDDEEFSQRPEQEPKEKATEETRILLLGVQSLVLPTSSQQASKAEEFQEVPGVKGRARVSL